MNKPLDLKQLQHFVAIYEFGSLLSAANQIGVGQSALTKSLKKLEESLGLQLFARTTRELIPTVPAHQLYHKAQDVLAEASDLQETAHQLVTGEQGSVTIGCGPLPAEIVLVPLISQLRKEGCEVDIKFVTAEFDKLLQGLLTYQYDFLLFDMSKLGELPDPERFHVTPIIEEPVDLVAAPDFYEKFGSFDPIKDELNIKFAGSSQKPPQAFLDQLPKELHHREANYQIENAYSCLSLAKAGLAATVVPRVISKPAIENGEVIKVDLPFEVNVNIGAYRLRSRSINTTTQIVINALEQISAD